MNIIFILRQLSKKEINRILRDIKNKETTIFYEETGNLPEELLHIKNETITVSQSGIGELWNETIKEINDFGHKTFNEKSIIEWLSWKGNTFWYYIRPILFINYKAHRVEIEKILSTLSKIDLNTVETFHLFGGSFATGFYFEKKIRVFVHGTPEFRIVKYAKLINYIIIFLLRFTIGIFQLVRLFNKKNKHVVFEDAYKIQNIIDLKTLKSVKGDSYIEYFKEKAYQNSDFLLLSELSIPNLAKDPLPLRKEYIVSKYLPLVLYGEVFLALSLLNPLTWIQFLRFNNNLKKSFSSVLTNHPDPNDRLLITLLSTMRTIIAFCLLREKAAELFHFFFKPATIGGDHEHELKNKPYLTVAKRMNIPTYGIQHGTIHPLHFHYFFSGADKNFKPYPDWTIMWGDYWKQMITSNSIFNETEIKVLGHTRTDCIHRLKQLKKSDVLPGFDEKRPLVLFASQWVRGGEEYMRKRIMDDYLKLAESFPDYYFLVKPHPLETDISLYKQFQQDNKNKNFLLVNEDVYKLIAVSDVVLVFTSTVGAEVVYFKKNLVILNYFNNDFSDYIKDGVAFGAANYNELQVTVQKCLNKEIIIDEHEQERFIEERAYKIDGKTCDRYIAFIRSLGRK